MTVINRVLRAGAAILLLTHLTGTQAQDLVGEFVGSISGLVEDDKGNMVTPEAAVQTSISVLDKDGVLSASITGTASCTNGLGLHITFEADYDGATGSLTGFYTDIPGSTELDTPIDFVNIGDLNWTAHISGMAPSASGPRAYDLDVNISLPASAIFAGDSYPENQSFSGDLSVSLPVTVPIEVAAIGLSETLTIPMELTGEWSAKAVPLDNGTAAITGSASGTFGSTETVPLTVSIPLLGSKTFDVGFSGSFGGTLFTLSDTELAFQGSWAADTSNGSLGGDLNITIPINDLSAFPFTIEGSIPVDTGVPTVGELNIPFSVSGSIPISF